MIDKFSNGYSDDTEDATLQSDVSLFHRDGSRYLMAIDEDMLLGLRLFGFVDPSVNNRRYERGPALST